MTQLEFSRLAWVGPLIQGLKKQGGKNQMNLNTASSTAPVFPIHPTYTHIGMHIVFSSLFETSNQVQVFVSVAYDKSRLYLYVCMCSHEQACVNVCPDGIILWLQILPHLIWGVRDR